MTVTVTFAELLQPFVVPVTVYVVVVVGLAIGLEIRLLLKPTAGDQLYVVAPFADIDVLLPEHIVAVPDAVTLGIGFTVMVTLAVSLHPFVVPVTV